MWTSHFRRIRRRWLLAPVACLVFVGGALPAVTQAQQADVTLNIVEPSASDPMAWGFDIANQTVTPGQTIAWLNTGAQMHTVTADDNSFDSGNIDPGGTYSLNALGPGTYAYHCTPHPWMTGTFTVSD